MASKDQENLGKYFYEPEIASQISGVAQKTSLPMTSDEKGLTTGLHLGSGIDRRGSLVEYHYRRI